MSDSILPDTAPPKTGSALLDFDSFCELLMPLGALNSPSELHGLLCGKLCGGAVMTPDQWQQAAWELLDVTEEPKPELIQQVAALHDSTQQQLQSGDYNLTLLLPDDDSDLEMQTQALSQWCNGFLMGFGTSGIDPETGFSSDDADALRDLASIVQVGMDEEREEEAQEADFIELVEYVRIVALNFFEQHSTEPVGKNSPELADKNSPELVNKNSPAPMNILNSSDTPTLH